MWEAHHQTQLLLNAVCMSFHSKIEPWSSNYHLDWMLLGLLTMMCSSSRQAFLEERLSINCVWTSLAVIVLRAKWSSTVIDLHLLPALVFAPGDPKKFACRLTVFEVWTSLAVIVLRAEWSWRKRQSTDKSDFSQRTEDNTTVSWPGQTRVLRHRLVYWFPGPVSLISPTNGCDLIPWWSLTKGHWQ